MSAPTAADIRNELEGYGISASVLSDAWIERCRDNEIIPHVKDLTRMDFTAVQSITEYYSGNGTDTIMLNRRPVISIMNIRHVGSIAGGNLANAVELVSSEGIVKAISNFNEGIWAPVFLKGYKNIAITYTYGYADYPDDINRAIRLLVCAKLLVLIGARTGGGSLSVQAHSRNYGTHGKYTDIRKEFVQSGYGIIRRYMTGVTGS